MSCHLWWSLGPECNCQPSVAVSILGRKKVFDATLIITKDIMNENTFVFVQEEESRFFPLSVQKEGCFCLVPTTKQKFYSKRRSISGI